MAKDKLEIQEESKEKRGTWANPAEFVLSCLGYAVGLGNVWRFPYLCYENGGGAFLIPYAIMLTFVGLPLFFIELSVGQYSASGPMTVWAASPLFQGVGAGMIVISFIGSVYYNMIIGWSLYYLFGSFQAVLPWKGCDHPSYNTENCYSKEEATPCEAENGTWYNQTCYNASYIAGFDEVCNGTSECLNETYNPITEMLKNATGNRISPSEEYFNHAMLGRSETMGDTGGIKWDLCLTLLLAWIICFLCVIKGIKSSGKVVYFTATFPYLVLLILFFRGVTLPGAGKGVEFYIYPKWEMLLSPKVWADAAGQIFFSLSVGMGGLMTFASYNKFHNNVYRDTLIVAISNCLTSFFAGFVIFSILGHMAHNLGVDVQDVAKSGSGLAFIAYPDVVTQLPVSQLWSILFFLMLITLGLDSQFAGIENIMTAIVDMYPRLRPRKTYISLGICVLLFLIGIPMTTKAGVYWLELMGYFSSGWSLVLIGLAEAIIFPWVYGARRLMKDIETMVGFKLYMHWWVCWVFITPGLIIAILIFNFYQFTPLSYGDYELPSWAQALGWMMAVASVAMIPIFMGIQIWLSYKNPDYHGLNFLKRLRKLMQPSEDWKPSIEKEKDFEDTVPARLTSPPPYTIHDQITSYDNSGYRTPGGSIDQTKM